MMEDKKDEDIDIDFSKIKDFFKNKIKGLRGVENNNKGSEKEEERKEPDSVDIDFSKIKKFFQNSVKKYSLAFLVLMPIILSIYIRMQSAYLPITEQWAANGVINSIRSQVLAQVNNQYPNLPDSNKNAIAESELQKFMLQNKAQVEQQIKATSNYFKSYFQDENGKNYMPDIDPYYWYRYSKNILEKGMIGDEIRDGKQWDNHQLAPKGRPVTTDRFHSYFLAYFYKFLHFFDNGLTLMRSMMYYPVVVSAAIVLLVFLIGRNISGSNAGGFFAALMAGVNTSIIGRTLFGHADSDAWVVFFPLLITWLFTECLESRNFKKSIIFSILAGFFTGMFAYAWIGWSFILYLLLGMIGISALYFLVINFKEIRFNPVKALKLPSIKNLLIIGIVFVISTMIFVTIFMNFNTFKSASRVTFGSIKDPVRSASVWPNVLTTVAELNEGSANQIINSIGGKLIWYLGILGILLSVLKRDVYGHRDIKYAILLAFWVASTFYASLKGIRFTLLLAPAISIAFGTSLGYIYNYCSKWLVEGLNIHKHISKSILVVILLLFYINITNASLNTARGDIPIVNDAWYNSFIKIRDNTPTDTIITSWWDFGHYFKSLAERAVTFDGTTQESPNAHWVGRLLMTSDEEEAIGILRMIDCSQNDAYFKLLNIMGNQHKALGIVKKIIKMSKESAKEELKNNKLEEKDIDEVIGYTHCRPRPAVVIASEDMIGKSGVWGHFGSWNFERADIWFNTKNKGLEEAVGYIQDNFNYTKENAENTYFEIQALNTERDANTWIAPWPGYGGVIGCSRDENQTMFTCGNGFQINLTNLDIFGIGQQGIVRPRLFAYPTEDGIKIKDFDDGVSLGMTLVPKGKNNFDIVLSNAELIASTFTKMFYLNGHSLKYFKLISHEKGLTGTEVYVYEVDWEGKNMTLVDDYLNNLKTEMASNIIPK